MKPKLTDLVLDIVGHAGHFVEQAQRLVHALLDDSQMGQHLRGVGRHLQITSCQVDSVLIRVGAEGHLRSDLRCLLGVHHADVLEVFEGVLPVLLLGAHVLLQQAEDVSRLRGQNVSTY